MLLAEEKEADGQVKDCRREGILIFSFSTCGGEISCKTSNFSHQISGLFLI